MNYFIRLILLFSFIGVINANSIDVEHFTSIDTQKRYQNLINEIIWM